MFKSIFSHQRDIAKLQKGGPGSGRYPAGSGKEDEYRDSDYPVGGEKEDSQDEGKYNLVGVDGNAFSVMGYVKGAMRKEGKSKEEIDAYLKQAMSSDYDNLLSISSDMVESLNNPDEEKGGMPPNDAKEKEEAARMEPSGPVDIGEGVKGTGNVDVPSDKTRIVMYGLSVDKPEYVKQLDEGFQELGFGKPEIVDVIKTKAGQGGEGGRSDVIIDVDSKYVPKMATHPMHLDGGFSWHDDYNDNHSDIIPDDKKKYFKKSLSSGDIAKGGPGSGRYPAGSGGDKKEGAKLSDSEERAKWDMEDRLKNNPDAEKNIRAATGGLSDEVSRSYEFRNYVEHGSPGGYFGSYGRTKEKDVMIENELKAQGLKGNGISSWLSSVSARHLMDSVSKKTPADEFKKTLKRDLVNAAEDVAVWSHPDHIGNVESSIQLREHLRQVFGGKGTKSKRG